MTVTIGRRELLAALGGAAATWPRTARAQSNLRHIGVLMGWSQSDPFQSWLAAFVQELTRLGWRLAVNVRIDERWTYGDISRVQAFAKELVGMRPDVIVAGTTPVTAALHRETPTIPIVFAVVSDPVGAGFVGKLSQPGGNLRDSSTWKPPWAANGWGCSKRSHPKSFAQRSCSIPTLHLAAEAIF
jgi:putative tryptophan/tyrosine transport system substrate-binding protein